MYRVIRTPKEALRNQPSRRHREGGLAPRRALEWGVKALAWMAVMVGMAWALLSLEPGSPVGVEAALLAPPDDAAMPLKDGYPSSVPTAEARQAGVQVIPRTEKPAGVAEEAAGLATSAQRLPDEVFIEGVPAGRQQRKLSCELQSASDLAWFYGRPYTWEDVFVAVGHDPYGDPQRGWIGASLDDAPGQLFPNGYGVHAEPVARGLRALGLEATTHYGQDADWVRERLAAGQPVMVWAVAGMRKGEVESWTTLDGRTAQGVRFEHTFLVIGYDADRVYVSDPWDGKTHAYDWERFMESWNVLGRMALVVSGVCPGPCEAPPPP